MTFGEGNGSAVVGVVRLDDGTVRFDMLPAGVDAEWVLGRVLAAGGETTVRIDKDPRAIAPGVSIGGVAVNPAGVLANSDDVTYGAAPARDGVAPVTVAPVRPVPVDTTLCRTALGKVT